MAVVAVLPGGVVRNQAKGGVVAACEYRVCQVRALRPCAEQQRGVILPLLCLTPPWCASVLPCCCAVWSGGHRRHLAVHEPSAAASSVCRLLPAAAEGPRAAAPLPAPRRRLRHQPPHSSAGRMRRAAHAGRATAQPGRRQGARAGSVEDAALTGAHDPAGREDLAAQPAHTQTAGSSSSSAQRQSSSTSRQRTCSASAAAHCHAARTSHSSAATAAGS